MITIVHVLSDAQLTGAPAHVFELASGLDRALFRSIVVCPPGPLTVRLDKAGIRYKTISFSSKFDTTAKQQLREAVAAIQKEVDGGPMIVHCHGVRAGYFARMTLRNGGFPVVYTEHSWTKDYHLPNPINDWVQRLVLRYLDRYSIKTVAVSQAVADFLIDQRISAPHKVVKIYNGIRIPSSKIKPSSDPVIGSIGSLTWQKNYLSLVRLMPLILAKIPEARLEIVGAGPQLNELQRLIRELDVADSVTIQSPVPHERLAAIFAGWALYVQPSVNESFGLAMAEAVAAGLPALGNNVGSIPEVLGTKDAIFDLEDQEKAALKIVSYLKNKEKSNELWLSEFKVVSQFTSQKMVKAHAELYTDIAS